MDPDKIAPNDNIRDQSGADQVGTDQTCTDQTVADQPAGQPSVRQAAADQPPKGKKTGTRMRVDRRSAWLRKLDEECPYQVVLPRQKLTDDSEILDFLLANVGIFDMYVEDEYATFVRYCFADPMDAEMFRARFEPKVERLKLAG